MSKLEYMIRDLCPEGVRWVKLGEVGVLYGGLSGKSKKDFENGNAKFITYKNVYANPALNIDVEDKVQINPGEKQNTVQYGDILFTGSSETPDECAMSSVLTTHTDEALYLNSFCFGFRFNSLDGIIPEFYKHYFRCTEMRLRIAKTAHGTTRFNVSKKEFAQLSIPLPPLPIQEKIVEILEKFSLLSAELEAELEGRRKQYDFYRNRLLSFDSGSDSVMWKTLGEVACYAKSRISLDEVDEDNYVGVENLLQNKLGKTISTSVPTSGNCIEYIEGDILIGNIRPYLKKIWLADRRGGTNGDVLTIRILPKFSKGILPRYLFHLLSSEEFFNYDNQYAKGAKMPRGDKNAVLKYPIPIPPLAEQERIVRFLDKFEALVTDLSAGLPAEIERVQKQYEYYRNKLLTFPEA